ncbi:NAD-dependent epimerase/dehydratase family protein [Silvanigrella aquatica]|uniref:NAD(P)-binding domain-containing protein n=1 Tax=Silvanigrella aquatica TaxID=1915309 RepID=A0A1L4D396_9BACT|nr:NAD-dependent epimerase/dehydratase family protein [Silvanigrella aquatica]APJ04662.1 hypothetical protein AXG55_12410 [Silvanigrella aquatica]
MKHIVIAGGSGLLGSNVIAILSSTKNVSITCLTRRNLSTTQSQMLKEVLFDFENIEEYKKIGKEIPCDIFFCCIGTTLRNVKSFQNFVKVDRDYPIKFIENIKQNSPKTLFVFTSSIGVSNPRGYFLNAKCEVEKALTKSLLHYIIVRPSLLLGKRKEFRMAEKLSGIVLKKVDDIMKKFKINDEFSFSKYAPIEAALVAKTMVHHALNFDKVMPGMILEGDDLKFNEEDENNNPNTENV